MTAQANGLLPAALSTQASTPSMVECRCGRSETKLASHEDSHTSLQSSLSSVDDLVARVAELEERLAAQQAETDSKDQRIRSLQEQLSRQDILKTAERPPLQAPQKEPTTGSTSSPPTINIVDEVQKWLFLEGGDLRDVPSLLTEYCRFLRNEMGLPLDRLFVAGMMLPPRSLGLRVEVGIRVPHASTRFPTKPPKTPTTTPDEPYCRLDGPRNTA